MTSAEQQQKKEELIDLHQRLIDFLPYVKPTVEEEQSLRDIKGRDWHKFIEDFRLNRRASIVVEATRITNQLNQLDHPEDCIIEIESKWK